MNPATLANKIGEISATAASLRVVAGFDAFVDEVVQVVGTRSAPDAYAPVATIGEFGDWVSASALLLETAPEQGAKVAVKAAESLAARGAHDEAFELWQQALSLLSTSERAHAHRRMGELAQARADFRTALRHFTRARVRGDVRSRRELWVPAARVLG